MHYQHDSDDSRSLGDYEVDGVLYDLYQWARCCCPLW